MVKQLELEYQNVMFIAELIDLLLLNLVPNWKPCIDISHLVSPNCKRIIAQLKDPELARQKQILEESSHMACEDAHYSASTGRPIAIGNHDHLSLNETSSHDYHSTTRTFDLCSEISYASATSDITRVTGGSESSFASIGGSLDYHDTTCSSAGPSRVSSFSNLEDELKIELDMIEHKYQEAIKEISRQRYHAIMEARRKLSQKKIQL